MKVKEQSERPDKLKKTKKSEKYDAEDLLTNSDSELPKKQRLFLLAQEIKFAKYLAGNDVRFSDKQLKKLKKWLKLRSQSNYRKYNSEIELVNESNGWYFLALEFDDLLRLWKGLFYCMWMSDKPLVQEDLTEEIASIIECLSKTSESIVFYGAFLKVMALEWFGIDQWRIDKFMMVNITHET